jgi:hypothetical protein
VVAQEDYVYRKSWDSIFARFIPIALEIANGVTLDDNTPRSWGSVVLEGMYRVMCNRCCKTKPNSALLGCPLFI